MSRALYTKLPAHFQTKTTTNLRFLIDRKALVDLLVLAAPEAFTLSQLFLIHLSSIYSPSTFFSLSSYSPSFFLFFFARLPYSLISSLPGPSISSHSSLASSSSSSFLLFCRPVLLSFPLIRLLPLLPFLLLSPSQFLLLRVFSVNLSPRSPTSFLLFLPSPSVSLYFSLLFFLFLFFASLLSYPYSFLPSSSISFYLFSAPLLPFCFSAQFRYFLVLFIHLLSFLFLFFCLIPLLSLPFFAQLHYFLLLFRRSSTSSLSSFPPSPFISFYFPSTSSPSSPSFASFLSLIPL